MVRALDRFPPMWPGFDSQTSRRHMRVEFVVRFRPCFFFFLRVLRFSSLPTKTHLVNFQFDQLMDSATLWKCHCILLFYLEVPKC